MPFTILVLPPLPKVTQSPLPTGIVAHSYAAQFSASGGTPPYSWTLAPPLLIGPNTVSGLPAGITLNTDGSLTGTPTFAGNFSFTVQVTDSATPPQSASINTTISVRQNAFGRNDTIQTATLIGAGGYSPLSISPFSDPSQSTPDSDYFRLVVHRPTCIGSSS
jgi:hypothetical protein